MTSRRFSWQRVRLVRPGELPGWRIAGYSVGRLGVSLAWSFLSSFLLYFYTDIAGLTAAAATTLLLVARVWDAINDPMVGVMADRSRTPWGRYRPWLLLGSIPFGILLVLTLTAQPQLSAAGRLIYAYATYFALVLAYTVVHIPQIALLSVMTPDARSRSVLASTMSMIMTVSGLLIGVAGLPLLNHLGGGNIAEGFRSTASFFAILAVVTLWITFFTSRETIFSPPGENLTLGKLAASVLLNRPLLTILFGQLLGSFVMYGRMSTAVYYFQYYAGRINFYQTYSLVWFGGMMCGAYYAPAITRAIGKKAAICLTTFFAGTILTLTYFVHPAQIISFLACTALGGLFFGCRMATLFSMMPETADYGQKLTGVRADGVLSSVLGLTMKLGTAAGSAAVGYLLARVGYQPQAVQPAAVLQAFNLLMNVFPGLGTMLTILPFIFYPLDS